MTALSDPEGMIAPEHEGSGNHILQQGEKDEARWFNNAHAHAGADSG